MWLPRNLPFGASTIGGCPMPNANRQRATRPFDLPALDLVEVVLQVDGVSELPRRVPRKRLEELRAALERPPYQEFAERLEQVGLLRAIAQESDASVVAKHLRRVSPELLHRPVLEALADRLE